MIVAYQVFAGAQRVRRTPAIVIWVAARSGIVSALDSRALLMLAVFTMFFAGLGIQGKIYAFNTGTCSTF